MATASSNINDDLVTSPRSSDAEDDDDDDSAAGQLQKFCENDMNVKPADKIPFVINLCFAYLDDFSTQAAPYNHQLFKNSKKNHKISNPLLKVEIKRRDFSAKVSNKKQNEVLLVKSTTLLRHQRMPPNQKTPRLRHPNCLAGPPSPLARPLWQRSTTSY